MATTDINIDTLREWRISTFEELGFSKLEAEQLVDVRTTVVLINRGGLPKRYEQLLDHHDARRLIDQGATLAQVLRIYL